MPGWRVDRGDNGMTRTRSLSLPAPIREAGSEPMPYPVASYGRAMVEPTYAVLRGEVGEHWVCVAGGRHLALIERREGTDPAPVIARTLRPD